MRRRVVLATMVSASVGAAQPPALAPPDEFKPRVEYVVRVGASWMQTDTNVGAAPRGGGPCLDAEVAWSGHYLSVSAFGAFYTLRAKTYANDQSTATWTDARYGVVDLGLRVGFHHGGHPGPIVGIGVAYELVLESGHASSCVCANNYCDPCTPSYSNQAYTQQSQAPLFEMHVGAALPKIGPFMPEVIVLLGLGFNPDDPGFFQTTERLEIGARF